MICKNCQKYVAIHEGKCPRCLTAEEFEHYVDAEVNYVLDNLYQELHGSNPKAAKVIDNLQDRIKEAIRQEIIKHDREPVGTHKLTEFFSPLVTYTGLLDPPEDYSLGRYLYYKIELTSAGTRSVQVYPDGNISILHRASKAPEAVASALFLFPGWLRSFEAGLEENRVVIDAPTLIKYLRQLMDTQGAAEVRRQILEWLEPLVDNTEVVVIDPIIDGRREFCFVDPRVLSNLLTDINKRSLQ